MNRTLNRILKIVGIVLLAIAAALAAYVIYMQATYYRIEDNLPLEIKNNQSAGLDTGAEYTALTYNVGFGAYDPSYTFFMDKGVMEDGTPVSGVHGRAASEDSMMRNIQGSAGVIREQDVDFVLMQEVDEHATRSFYYDQKAFYESQFPEYASVFALNFHAPYMILPVNEPHGSVQAGLLSLSKHKIDDAKRISYPVSTAFFEKFFELDRCIAQVRIPVSNGKELVLMNNHMSAYDEGGTLRKQQLQMLNQLMTEEFQKGNYVIVGGDFNQELTGKTANFPSQQKVPEWVNVIGAEEIAPGMHIVQAKNAPTTPTCRSCDIPYQPGVNYTAILDGFIVSDNVQATAEHIDTGFAYSDHNPVKLTFALQ